MSQETTSSPIYEEGSVIYELGERGDLLNPGYEAASEENLKSKPGNPWMVPVTAISTRNNLTPRCMRAIVIASTVIIIGLLILLCFVIVILGLVMSHKEVISATKDDILAMKRDISAIKQDTSTLKEFSRIPSGINVELQKGEKKQQQSLKNETVSSQESITSQTKLIRSQSTSQSSTTPILGQDQDFRNDVTSVKTAVDSSSSTMSNGDINAIKSCEITKILDLRKSTCNLCLSVCVPSPDANTTTNAFPEQTKYELSRHQTSTVLAETSISSEVTSLANIITWSQPKREEFQSAIESHYPTNISTTTTKSTSSSTTTERYTNNPSNLPTTTMESASTSTTAERYPANPTEVPTKVTETTSSSTRAERYPAKSSKYIERTTNQMSLKKQTSLRPLVHEVTTPTIEMMKTKPTEPVLINEKITTKSSQTQTQAKDITTAVAAVDTTDLRPTESTPSESTPLGQETSSLIRPTTIQTTEETKPIKTTTERDNDIVTGWYNASNGLYYKYRSDAKTYQAAAFTCKYMGARLASTGMRDVAVKEALHKLTPSVQFWIGLDERKETGHWVWSDGVAVKEADILWDVGQPNHAGGILPQHCVEIVYNGRFNDDTCILPQPYLCEKEKS